MTNRQKIVKAAKDAGVKIESLEFIRSREHLYGDSLDNSHWMLNAESDDYFSSEGGDGVDDGVRMMIQEILST